MALTAMANIATTQPSSLLTRIIQCHCREETFFHQRFYCFDWSAWWGAVVFPLCVVVVTAFEDKLHRTYNTIANSNSKANTNKADENVFVSRLYKLGTQRSSEGAVVFGGGAHRVSNMCSCHFLLHHLVEPWQDHKILFVISYEAAIAPGLTSVSIFKQLHSYILIAYAHRWVGKCWPRSALLRMYLSVRLCLSLLCNW